MPQRAITVPSAILLVNPESKEPMEPAVDFGVVLRRLLANPLWAESLANMRAQQGIERAWHRWEDAELFSEASKEPGALVLAEDDWALLKRAAETPRTVIGDAVSIGLGYHPQLVSQLVPFLAAIVEAVAC